MDPRFTAHNSHLPSNGHGGGLAAFKKQDPHLKNLQDQLFVHCPALLKKLPFQTPGIYTLGGGRQIGKTTALKQWMETLLDRDVRPENIAFFTGELIDDHHSLVRLLQEQLERMPKQGTHYLVVDEVTYITQWDKGVKFMADAGLLTRTVLLLTGSDLLLMKDARARFPGRRGKSAQVDYHLYPLSFHEAVDLKHKRLPENPDKRLDLLYKEFDNYLIHGGFLTALNDFSKTGTIQSSTLATYADWIRGDMIKRGKQETYMREILSAIVKKYGSQITWNSLASELSIDHPKTVADYVENLVSMDAAVIQPAIIEDKLVGAPKKAKKLAFTDPFIFHAVRSWLNPVQNPFEKQIIPAVQDPSWAGRLAEATVAAHFQRAYPTYYIKAEGEVDIAYVDQGRFWPMEIKWTSQLRTQELKQISKYKNARIWAQVRDCSEFAGIPVEPLPLALYSFTGQT